jgi:hypothetical protein
MQTHGPIKIFDLHVIEGTDLDNPGVIDQDVDLAEALDALLDGRVYLGGIEQITWKRQDFASLFHQLHFGAIEFVRIAREQSDFTALSANFASERQTKSARTTGDENHFILEQVAARSNQANEQPGGQEKTEGED